MNACQTKQSEEFGTKKPMKRFHHLDALRGALMIWGVIVHGGCVGHNEMIVVATQLSGLVRMEAFFWISGFLGALLVGRKGAKEAVSSRLLAVGLPFVVCAVMLNPVTNVIMLRYHNPGVGGGLDFLLGGLVGDFKGQMGWHLHLWFLACLFIYVTLLPLLCLGAARMRVLLADRELIKSDWQKFIVLTVSLMTACLASRVVFELFFEPWILPAFAFIVRSTGYYLPFYAVGVFCNGSATLDRVINRPQWVHLVIAGLLLWFTVRSCSDLPKIVYETLVLLLQVYVATSMLSVLLWLSARFVKSKNVVARILSDSAYTVYLFHYIVIYALATGLRPLVGDREWFAPLVALMTVATTLGLHYGLIARIGILRLLFNGRPWKLQSERHVRSPVDGAREGSIDSLIPVGTPDGKIETQS